MVGVLKPSPGGKAVSDTGGSNAKRGEDFDKVVCGGLTFDVGAEGEYDLGGGFQADALDEADDTKLIGTHMVEGSESAP